MTKHRASVDRYELTADGETFSAVRASDYDALEERFDDYMDDYVAVINEDCAGDEKHCTCVPILRAEVERLNDLVARLRRQIDAALAGEKP